MKGRSDLRLLTVVGARPQFVKAAVVSRAIAASNAEGNRRIAEILVHTGQHFDDDMSGVFFRELSIPQPQHNLGVHGLSHGAMTGRMLEAVEGVLLRERPDMVLVYGDTNSTLAAALAAAKLHLPVAHVEAGLRSFNRRMPEEVNRIAVDHVSSLLFCPSEAAERELRAEGVGRPCGRAEQPLQRVVRSGDVMCDAVRHYSALAARPEGLAATALAAAEAGGFALCTAHRSENVDDPQRLRSILEALATLAGDRPVLFPVHPRTRAAMEALGPPPSALGLHFLPPQGYLHLLWLLGRAGLVLTDSGGLQKEAYFLRRPAVVLREQTEWVELLEVGACELAGAERGAILGAAGRMWGRRVKDGDVYGDGRAGERIVRELLRHFGADA